MYGFDQVNTVDWFHVIQHMVVTEQLPTESSVSGPFLQTKTRMGAVPVLLPIRVHADRILEAVRANPVTVVIGETGSGKTTHISQV